MQLKNKSEIINKMFNYEVENLKEKYLNISNTEVNNIMDKIIYQNDKNYILENVDLLISLVEQSVLIDENIISLYVFLNKELKRIYEIEETVEIWTDIYDYGCTRFDNFIIYKDYSSLKKFATKIIYTQLGINFYGYDNKTFIVTKQNMEEYLFKRKTKEQIAGEIISKHDVEELLDISPVVAFKDVDGNKIYYSYINI